MMIYSEDNYTTHNGLKVGDIIQIKNIYTQCIIVEIYWKNGRDNTGTYRTIYYFRAVTKDGKIIEDEIRDGIECEITLIGHYNWFNVFKAMCECKTSVRREYIETIPEKERIAIFNEIYPEGLTREARLKLMEEISKQEE